jgi:hypothetical protein
MCKLRLQFGLRTLFICSTLCGLSFAFARYWKSTQELRKTLELVQNASSGEQARKLYSSLVWNGEQELAKQIGFDQLRALSNEGAFPKLPEVVWQSRFENASGEQQRVFLLSTNYLRPHFTTIVVTDDRYRLVSWSDSRCEGSFTSATIQRETENPQLGNPVKIGYRFSAPKRPLDAQK